jgi:hypothetical protein
MDDCMRHTEGEQLAEFVAAIDQACR